MGVFTSKSWWSLATKKSPAVPSKANLPFFLALTCVPSVRPRVHAGIGPGLSETLRCKVLVGLALVGLRSSFGVLGLKIFSEVMEINPSDSCGPMEFVLWLCPMPESFTERCPRLTCCWAGGIPGIPNLEGNAQYISDTVGWKTTSSQDTNVEIAQG